MAESLTARFVMYGARDAIAGGMAHLQENVDGIESAVVENPGLAFDLAKTLVETVCRALLTERAIPFSTKDNLQKLFRAVTQSLSLLPPEASAEAKAHESLKKTLSGLHTAIQGISELRNRFGFAHGSGTPRPPMESVQALLAAEAADTIVGFLCRVNRQDRTPLTSMEPKYDDNAAFNESVDDMFGMIRIFEAEFRSSEVLFRMEPETYRVYLADFDAESEKDSPDGEPSETAT